MLLAQTFQMVFIKFSLNVPELTSFPLYLFIFLAFGPFVVVVSPSLSSEDKYCNAFGEQRISRAFALSASERIAVDLSRVRRRLESF